MGLDITAISEIKPIEVPEGIQKYSDEYYDWENELNVGHLWGIWFNPSFPTQQEGLPEADTVFSEGEEYGFRAGSYSGYGEWRNDLALAAMGVTSSEVWDKSDGGETGMPFQELINFPDNEGLIGPIASERLYQDFVNYESQIDKAVDWWYLKMSETKEYNSEDVKWFKSKYKDWKHAFDIARNNGMVIFH